MAHCYPDGRFEITNLAPGAYTLQSKTEWMSSVVNFASTEVDVSTSQILSDIEVKVEGESAQLWRFRVLSTQNEF